MLVGAVGLAVKAGGGGGGSLWSRVWCGGCFSPRGGRRSSVPGAGGKGAVGDVAEIEGGCQGGGGDGPGPGWAGGDVEGRVWTHAPRVRWLEGEGMPQRGRWARQRLAPGQGTAFYHHRPPPPAPGMRTYPCDNLMGCGSTVGRWLEGRLRAEWYKFQHRALLSSGGLRAPRAAGLGQRWGAGHAGPADRPAGGRQEVEADSGPD